MSRQRSQHRDPVMTLKRWRHIVTVVGVMAMLGASVWAVWPVPRADRESLSFAPQPENAANDGEGMDSSSPPWNADVFTTVRLWNPPPGPAQPQDTEQHEVIVKRPQLELIGIIEENGAYSAALYDRDRGEMRIVASGDRIEPYLVATITSDEVRLEDGRHTARLVVRDNEEGPSP